MTGNKTGPRHRGEKGDWFQCRWYPALPLLPDEQREMPNTYGDAEYVRHPHGCTCEPCNTPYLRELRAAKWERTKAILESSGHSDQPPPDPIAPHLRGVAE